jgi:hypothetical protein
VDLAPSRDLKSVPPKVETWSNVRYKPGASNVKIDNRKFDYSKAQAKVNTHRKTAAEI